jgi:hypothetical protein
VFTSIIRGLGIGTCCPQPAHSVLRVSKQQYFVSISNENMLRTVAELPNYDIAQFIAMYEANEPQCAIVTTLVYTYLVNSLNLAVKHGCFRSAVPPKLLDM